MAERHASGWAALFADARTRHGAFHLRRCAAFGLSVHTVRKRAQREAWQRPHPGVHLLPGSVDGWWPKVAAWLEAVGPDAALALRSAAYAQGMLPNAPAMTEVIRANGRHKPRGSLLAVRTSRTLTPASLEVVDGLRCTTPSRTMCDLAHVLDVEPLRAFGIEGLRVGSLDLTMLEAEIERMRPGTARRRLQEVVGDLLRTNTESPFAYQVIEAIAAEGFAVEGEYPWRCPDGQTIHFDAAIPSAWVAIECDGRGKYQNGTSFTTDRIRWTQASGRWRTVWVSWDRWVRQRDAVLADVARAVADADPDAAPPLRATCRCKRCRAWARHAAAAEDGDHYRPGS